MDSISEPNIHKTNIFIKTWKKSPWINIYVTGSQIIGQTSPDDKPKI
jgi:hypothetical protein